MNIMSLYCDGCGISARDLRNDLPISVASESWTGRAWNAVPPIYKLIGAYRSIRRGWLWTPRGYRPTRWAR
jgi:hypothetical protein